MAPPPGTPTGSLNWVELKEMRNHLASLAPVKPTPIKNLHPNAPAAAVEFLEQLLCFEPSVRQGTKGRGGASRLPPEGPRGSR